MNPFRYDGRDGARYDAADGLYWLSVRAYDPTLGRFLSRDPLGRAPLFFSDNPYVYAGNNPLSNVDPSGQRVAGASAAQVRQAARRQMQIPRMVARSGSGACSAACLARGRRILAFLRNLAAEVVPDASMIADAVDMGYQLSGVVPLLTEVLAQDWAALAPLFRILAHLTRDGLDLMLRLRAVMSPLGVGLGISDGLAAQFGQLRDFLTAIMPLVDIAADVIGIFSLPQWASDKLRSLVAPLITQWLARKLGGSALPWLIGMALRNDAPWILSYGIDKLGALTPAQFCSIPAAGALCNAGWIPDN